MESKKIPTVNIMNCPIHSLTMGQTIKEIENNIKLNKQTHHVVVNAAKLVNMQTDKTLYDAVVNCDIINADGQSIVWASRILKQPLPERVAGADLMINLMDLAGEKGYKVFLFGAKEEIVSKVAKMYRDKFGNQVITGYRNGYYAEGEEDAIAKMIAESAAQMLFVAISSPKKENFLNRYKDIINTPFIMGVGGTFDVISGHIKRAPIWMQKAGLEWLYRTYQEPKRMWKRYLITNTKFIELLFREKFSNKTR